MGSQWRTEDAGVLAVRKAANEAGVISREQTTHDFGVDIHLEFTDERDDATGRLLAIQVKTGSSYFAHATEAGWWFYVDEKHENYWLGHSLPVVLALHDDRDGNTYWARVVPETLERTMSGASKILVPSSQVLDTGAFERISRFATRRAVAATGAFRDSPNRHRVVMREAMQGAARDDARIAFELSRGTGSLKTTPTMYHMGDPMGRYVLTAYREFDEFLAMVIVVEHLTALNKLVRSANEPPVTLKELLSGFGFAMPNDAHPDETDNLKQYIVANASIYWGSPL
ncbi:DUF4365 domain-containing protein [Microbacterium sp. 22242]|uniref:DUF4365 domain-containing protein n=1 Tax=Microbacterium sp. 22242 TaxID=3453896 RepID=UPI003F863528